MFTYFGDADAAIDVAREGLASSTASGGRLP